MKKFVAIFAVIALAVILCIPGLAQEQKLFGGDTFGVNMKTVSDITPTEGYTVLPIIANKNVTFYRINGDKEVKAAYKEPTVKPAKGAIGQEALAENNAVRAFAAPPYANLNGYQCMLNRDGIIEIRFYGTAINLGLTRLPNQSEGPTISARVVIDGTEYNTEKGIWNPTAPDDAHRQIDKRVFTSGVLEDGWHTVRIYSTASGGTAYFDFYEIVETHKWVNGVCEICNITCAHSGGSADCTEQAICSICGLKYGEKAPDVHTGTEKWITTGSTHEKKYTCCSKVTVECEAHEWENGICTECGYICIHSGGSADCVDIAVCGICGEKYGEAAPAVHKELKNVPEKAATKTENGNCEYWYCSACGKYYSDAEGKTEIAKEDTVITWNPGTGVPALPAAVAVIISFSAVAVVCGGKRR